MIVQLHDLHLLYTNPLFLFYRNERENELSTYVRSCNDRLGLVVRQRLQDMNILLKDDELKTTF